MNKCKEDTITTLQNDLKTQSKTFQQHVDSLSLTINRLEDSLTSVKSSITEQSDKITHLLHKIKELDDRNTKLEQKCIKLEDDLRSLPENLLEEFEDRSRRRRNIIISGIPERSEGSADERMKADKDDVEEVLQTLWKQYDDELVRCHRIGRQTTGKSRLLRVVLQDEEAKSSILSNARELRKCPSYKSVYVNPDLTITQRKINKLLRVELKRRKDLGEDVLIRRNRIVARRENFQ